MSIAGLGTPESTWLPLLAPLPPLDLSALPACAVVVAPHPDDEVLAVGGLLRLLATAGVEVRVVAVTDGEASNPGGSLAPQQLAVLRRAETAAALVELGVPAAVEHLHLPDGGAAGLEAPVRAALGRAVTASTWLLAPWEHDGHPDHEAVGRAAETVAAATGAVLLAYPVWAWHWAGPDDLPWARARRIDLPPPVLAAKACAVAAFATQTAPLGPLPEDAPVLPAHVLARFARPAEVVLA